MTYAKGRRMLAGAALLALLGGCISLLPDAPPPPVLYRLEAGETPRAQTATKDLVLAVSTPSAPRSVSGADIVWRTGDQIAFMDGGAWDGATPDLLRVMLLDVVRQAGAVRAAAAAGSGVRADYEIRWDIAEFGVREGAGSSAARFAAVATLVDLRTRQIVATERFSAQTPLSRRAGSAAASALQDVARDGVGQIAAWAAHTAQPAVAASTSK